MSRTASVLLFAGALLISQWVFSSAAPTITPAANPGNAPRITLDAYEQATAPIAAEISAQVDRLRERLNTPPAPPQPTRDPFRYGERVVPRPKVVEPEVVVPPPPPPPELPRLVAITSETTAAGVEWRAAISNGDQIILVKAGDTLGPFVVRSVSETTLELTNPATGTNHKVVLQS